MQNHVDPVKFTARDVSRDHALTSPSIDIEQLLGAARRQARVVCLSVAIAVVLGAAYLMHATPQYTAVADLMIDSQKDKNSLAATVADLTFDTSAIDTQVEVMKSEKVALAVSAKLKLTSDSEFVGAHASIFSPITAFLRKFLSNNTEASKAALEQANSPERQVIARLKNELDIRRVARTYVLAVSYTSPDRFKAAAIANTFAEAYINDQLDSKFEATRRAATWMEARLTELKQQSLKSDLAVQKFKAANNIVVTGGDKPGLISDQQLTELNGEIVTAQSDTARAEARYKQIEELLQSGRTGIAVPDSLSNPVINDLRGKFLTTSKTEAQLEAKLGGEHIQVIALKREMDEYNRLIYAELQRIAESYRSDAQVARAKEQSLSSSMSSLVGQSALTNETLVQLRELEREAETYRALYKTFMERYQEALQQQSSPETEARVITAATAPRTASAPKSSLIMSLSVIIGIIAGASLAGVREYNDRVFRVASHVREEMGLEFLGMLEMIRRLPAPKLAEGQPHDPKHLELTAGIQRYSIDHPLTGFSETLRSAKVAVDLALGDRRSKIVGIISVLPNEGKSTVSKNFASLMAHLGARTLLIDADLRNPGLTRSVARHAHVGLLEALRREGPLEDYLCEEPDSGLRVLPAVVRKRVLHSSEVVSSAGMRSLLEEATKMFDYVVLDLPPLGPVIDVRAASAIFDAFVFVAEWGRTPRVIAQNLLGADEALYDKCVGVIYNKVNLSRVNLYESYGSRYYYYGKYGKYYHKERA